MGDIDILAHAKVLWDYHLMDQAPSRADFVLVLGSHDTRAAGHAASIFNEKRSSLIVCSGGYGKVTRDAWKEPEGLHFKRLIVAMGVPDDSVLAECEATNTGDNFLLAKKLLVERGISVDSGVIVTKPYMSRRAFATGAKQWPEVQWRVSSPPISFEDYPNAEVPLSKMINLMVGDLQRIAVYPDRGFQIPQHIPERVWASYKALVDAGYSDFVMPGEVGA